MNLGQHETTSLESNAWSMVNRYFVHLWVLLDVQPAHVREEEPTRGVVRVGVQFGVLVVHPVVPGPVVDGALVGHRIDEHEEYAGRPVRIVGSVSPQAVHASGNSKPTDVVSFRCRGCKTEVYINICLKWRVSERKRCTYEEEMG